MGFINNPIYVLTVLSLVVILGVYVGKTKLGKHLGAALLIIIFTAVLANLKVIPSASTSIPLYDGIFTYVAPISIFYLLLNINISSIKRAGIPMIGLFILGSFATALGILISWYVLTPENTLGEDGKIIAGMLTGTYTGGSINFNAIALEYGFQKKGALYAGTIAVDNVITTLWIIVTLAFPILLSRFWPAKTRIKRSQENEEFIEDESINLTSLMWLVFLGLGAYYVSDELKKYVPQVPSIITISTIGILLAQATFVSKLKGSHNLGLYLVFLFLAVIGAYCELAAVIDLKDLGLTLLLFAGFSVVFHGVIIILVGGFIYRDWEMIAIVSQANVGGSTTAIALAESFNRKELIVPAILVGSLGNALGTYLGFLVIYIL